MAQKACSQCGFLNFSISAYCARCEQPLADGVAPLSQASITTKAPVPPPLSRQKTAPLADSDARQEKTVMARAEPTSPGMDAPLFDLDLNTLPEAPSRPINPPVATRAPRRMTTSEHPQVAPRPQNNLATPTNEPRGPTAAAPLWPKPTQEQHSERTTISAFVAPDSKPSHAKELDARQRPTPQDLSPSLAKHRAPQATASPRVLRPQNISEAEHTQMAEGHVILQIAGSRRQALAHVIDFALATSVSVGIFVAHAIIFDHPWPQGRPTFLESLSMWLHTYHHSCERLFLLMAILGLSYVGLGVMRTKTLGRFLLGLKLWGENGQAPSVTQALWHIVGTLISALSLGAGYYWLVVDSRRRTWANIMSKTLVIRG